MLAVGPAIEQLQQVLEVSADGVHERLAVGRADRHASIGEQPRRQPAELPVGVDVRADVDNQQEAEPVHVTHEIRQAPHSVQADGGSAPLVEVPRNARRHRVDAGRAHAPQSLLPLRRVNTEIVKLACIRLRNRHHPILQIYSNVPSAKTF